MSSWRGFFTLAIGLSWVVLSTPKACASRIRSYQLWLPATCRVVALRRLKRLVVAIMRIKAASPCSS
jgi:hypothetical protein